MSLVRKTKILNSNLENSSVSLPSKEQIIVKVLGGRGNNLHEVEDISNGEQFLVSMPVKFRKLAWIKSGDYVIVDPIIEGKKVKAEISQILTKDKVKFLKMQNVWPEKTGTVVSGDQKIEDVYEFVNTNRKEVFIENSDDSSSENDSH